MLNTADGKEISVSIGSEETKETIVGARCAVVSPEDELLSRGSVVGAAARWSLPRKISVASAALFAQVASWRTETAEAGNWQCCNLAVPGTWCHSDPGDPPFWCNLGGFKRVWYCCTPSATYGCGECQSGTGTCFGGPEFYCSYGWGASEQGCV